MSENIRGALTSSNYNSAHTSSFTKLRYIKYVVITCEHLRSFQSIDYIRIVVF